MWRTSLIWRTIPANVLQRCHRHQFCVDNHFAFFAALNFINQHMAAKFNWSSLLWTLILVWKSRRPTSKCRFALQVGLGINSSQKSGKTSLTICVIQSQRKWLHIEDDLRLPNTWNITFAYSSAWNCLEQTHTQKVFVQEKVLVLLFYCYKGASKCNMGSSFMFIQIVGLFIS